MSRTTLLLLALLGSASALPLPDGGWVGWNCVPRQGCALERLNSAGQKQATGPRRQTSRTEPVLSTDGKTLYLGGDKLLALDAQSLNARWSVKPKGSGATFRAAVIAPSPDGKTLAVSHFWDREALPWGDFELRDAGTGALRTVIRHPGPVPAEDWTQLYRAVSALAFSPDSKTLALGSFGGGIRLRDLNTGKERTLPSCVGRKQAHAGQVRALLWLDEKTLVSAANDEMLMVWDIPTASTRRCLSIPGGVRELVRLPERLLAFGADSVTLLDAQDFRRVALLGPVAGGIQGWKVLGQRLKLGDGLSATLGERTWDLQTGAEDTARTLPLTEITQGGYRVSVERDLRVRVTKGGASYLLPFLALPPENARARLDGSQNWTLTLKDSRLTIGAAAWLRVMTMEGDTFQNQYVWNLETRKLEGCQTVSLGQMGWFSEKPDMGCRVALGK